MRRILLLLLAAPIALHAQVARDSVITVSTSRTTRVAADRATLYIVIEGSAETAPDAVLRVETKVKPVSDALRALGSRVEVDRPTTYSVGPTPPPNGYPPMPAVTTNLARALIRVQTTRADQLAQLIGAAIAAGASSVSSITFESSAMDSTRRARIADALAAARADAESMAQALGGRLGALVDASTTGSPNFQQPTTLNFDNRFGVQSMAPEVAIITNVTVRYRIVR